MKHNATTVNIRIKDFMKRKMSEFPELKEEHGPSVRVVQRGYFLEDIISMFSKKA